MTAHALIELLQECDPSMEVWFWAGSDNNKTVEAVEIESFNGYGPKVVTLR